jgi:hypothetical protein
MHPDTTAYNAQLDAETQAICELLAREIDDALPEAENKVWHGHPVWFLDGNPVVGYSKQKLGVVVLFWSGQSFDEPELEAEGSFKAAQIRYLSVNEVDTASLRRWLAKARDIQWDYQHIRANKGELARLK